MVDINLKFPFQRSAQGGFETNKTTLDAVADDLKLLLLTNHGERVVNTDFGANLRSLIFEQKGEDLNAALQDRVRSSVNKWMPYVNILNIDVLDSSTTPYLGENEVRLSITFSIGTIDDIAVLSIKLVA